MTMTTNKSSQSTARNPAEIVELALLEAQYLLLEANMAQSTLPHKMVPPNAACRDMSPYGR